MRLSDLRADDVRCRECDRRIWRARRDQWSVIGPRGERTYLLIRCRCGVTTAVYYVSEVAA
jgi:hypothetical protein